jgi:hypothetical protein
MDCTLPHPREKPVGGRAANGRASAITDFILPHLRENVKGVENSFGVRCEFERAFLFRLDNILIHFLQAETGCKI